MWSAQQSRRLVWQHAHLDGLLPLVGREVRVEAHEVASVLRDQLVLVQRRLVAAIQGLGVERLHVRALVGFVRDVVVESARTVHGVSAGRRVPHALERGGLHLDPTASSETQK
eukprot:983123-Rhodomonas_salina.2